MESALLYVVLFLFLCTGVVTLLGMGGDGGDVGSKTTWE